MGVTSLYTNIPQEEGIHTVCRAYETFYVNKSPIPTQLLEQALRLILQENSFQFSGKNYLQTHGTAMGTKMAVAFSNIFMNKVETEILSQRELKPLVWKRFIDDIFSLWTINRDRISLNKRTIIILRSNLRLKFPIRKQHSWTPTYWYTKVQDSKETQSLMCVFILNLLKHFKIRFLNPVTHKKMKRLH